MESKQLKEAKKKSLWSNEKWIKGLSLTFVFFLLLLGIGFFGRSTALSNWFCSSCHEMAPEFHTLKASSHVKANCVDCHSQPELGRMFVAKSSILSRITKHSDTSSSASAIKIRQEIPSKNCEKCHNMGGRKDSPSGDVIIPHDKHEKKDINCVVCHKGVAHGLVVERKLASQSKHKDWNEEVAISTMSNRKYTAPQMEICMACHEGREVTTKCGACHSTGMFPKSHKKKNFLTSTHGKLAEKDLSSCDLCHKYSSEEEIDLLEEESSASDYLNGATAQGTNKKALTRDYIKANSFCTNCHAKRPASHKGSFFASHATKAKKNQDSCLSCHDYVNGGPKPFTTPTCGSCHPAGHGDGWRTKHPRTARPPQRLEKSCFSCHPKNECTQCHINFQ